MRLTIKGTGLIDCDGTVADLGKEEYSRRYHERSVLAHAKLSKLEDIEDELGIGIDTLIEALKNGAYYKHSIYGDIPFQTEAFADGKKKKIKLGLEHRLTSIVVPTDEYGKTWALTKEELEGKR